MMELGVETTTDEPAVASTFLVPGLHALPYFQPPTAVLGSTTSGTGERTGFSPKVP
jgi:hypothetical protein